MDTPIYSLKFGLPYYSKESQMDVLKKIAGSLREKGYLVIGKECGDVRKECGDVRKECGDVPMTLITLNLCARPLRQATTDTIQSKLR
jgi:hypothetical protein